MGKLVKQLVIAHQEVEVEFHDAPVVSDGVQVHGEYDRLNNIIRVGPNKAASVRTTLLHELIHAACNLTIGLTPLREADANVAEELYTRGLEQGLMWLFADKRNAWVVKYLAGGKLS